MSPLLSHFSCHNLNVLFVQKWTCFLMLHVCLCSCIPLIRKCHDLSLCFNFSGHMYVCVCAGGVQWIISEDVLCLYLLLQHRCPRDICLNHSGTYVEKQRVSHYSLFFWTPCQSNKYECNAQSDVNLFKTHHT